MGPLGLAGGWRDPAVSPADLLDPGGAARPSCGSAPGREPRAPDPHHPRGVGDRRPAARPHRGLPHRRGLPPAARPRRGGGLRERPVDGADGRARGVVRPGAPGSGARRGAGRSPALDGALDGAARPRRALQGGGAHRAAARLAGEPVGCPGAAVTGWRAARHRAGDGPATRARPSPLPDARRLVAAAARATVRSRRTSLRAARAAVTLGPAVGALHRPRPGGRVGTTGGRRRAPRRRGGNSLGPPAPAAHRLVRHRLGAGRAGPDAHHPRPGGRGHGSLTPPRLGRSGHRPRGRPRLDAPRGAIHTGACPARGGRPRLGGGGDAGGARPGPRLVRPAGALERGGHPCPGLGARLEQPRPASSSSPTREPRPTPSAARSRSPPSIHSCCPPSS